MRPKSFRERPEGVTIAIPNWNHEYVLGRSVGSALRAVSDLKQRGIAAEVLVIDDFSRDGSVTLLRQLEALYAEQGLRVYLKPCNSGPADTRNLALQQASYRYILYLDADNEVLPENLHIFYRSIREAKAVVAYGNLVFIKDETYPDMLYNNTSLQPHIFDENYIDTFVLVDGMKILELGGYMEVFAQEDWMLNMVLCANGRSMVFIPTIIGYYYILSNSRVRELTKEEASRQRAFFKRVFDQLGIRKDNHMRTRHLRYHPDVGFF